MYFSFSRGARPDLCRILDLFLHNFQTHKEQKSCSFSDLLTVWPSVECELELSVKTFFLLNVNFESVWISRGLVSINNRHHHWIKILSFFSISIYFLYIGIFHKTIANSFGNHKRIYLLCNKQEDSVAFCW